MGEFDGPFVSAAFITLKEPMRVNDGAWTYPCVASAITVPHKPSGGYQCWFVLSLSGGTRRGSRQFAFAFTRPHGDPEPFADPVTLTFDGPGYGHQMMPTFWLPLDREGMAWIDVFVDGIVLTRVPILVTHSAT